MVLFFITSALVIFLTIFPKIEPRKSHLTYFIKVDPMRNRFALSFLWLSLAFLPIACNPKSDDRAAGGNSAQPTNETGAENQTTNGLTALNSGGGVFVTFQPDPSGNTASHYLTVTDAAGKKTETYVCADSIFNCDFFKKATSVTTSNCDSKNNCSAPTKVESIPTCNEDGEFSGTVHEIVSKFQTLREQRTKLAEGFIKYNKETYGKLENKKTDVAAQIKTISEMHPCTLLAADNDLIKGLQELSLDGEADAEMITGLVVSILAATAGIVGTVAYYAKNQNDFLKNLKDAQETAKTNLEEADKKLKALQIEGVDSVTKLTEAKKALEDAKLKGLTFSNEALDLLDGDKKKFKFGDNNPIEIKTKVAFDKLKAFAQIDSQEKFNALSVDDKNSFIDNYKVKNFEDFSKNDGLRQKMIAFLDDTSKALTAKLDDLQKATPKDDNEIKKLTDAGVKSTEDINKLEEDVKKWTETTDKIRAAEADKVKFETEKMLLEGVKNGKLAELNQKLGEIKEGKLNLEDLKEAISKAFGENNPLYKAISSWDSKTDLSTLKNNISRLNNLFPTTLKGTVKEVGGEIKKVASAITDLVRIGKNLGLTTTEMTPDQKLITEYVEKAVEYAKELINISGAQVSLNSEILMYQSQSLQSSNTNYVK